MMEMIHLLASHHPLLLQSALLAFAPVSLLPPGLNPEMKPPALHAHSVPWSSFVLPSCPELPGSGPLLSGRLPLCFRENYQYSDDSVSQCRPAAQALSESLISEEKNGSW